jgi:hypothetical protein
VDGAKGCKVVELEVAVEGGGDEALFGESKSERCDGLVVGGEVGDEAAARQKVPDLKEMRKN